MKFIFFGSCYIGMTFWNFTFGLLGCCCTLNAAACMPLGSVGAKVASASLSATKLIKTGQRAASDIPNPLESNSRSDFAVGVLSLFGIGSWFFSGLDWSNGTVPALRSAFRKDHLDKKWAGIAGKWHSVTCSINNVHSGLFGFGEAAIETVGV